MTVKENSTGPIVVVRRGPVLEVRIARGKANAIDAATSRIMGNVFAGFRDDPVLRVAILTGSGDKFFCPGWDLKAAAEGEAPDSDYGVGGFGGLQELPGLNKPVICAVNGLAFGGGFEIMISKPPPKASPLTAQITGLLRPGNSWRPPKPPTP